MKREMVKEKNVHRFIGSDERIPLIGYEPHNKDWNMVTRSSKAEALK